MVEIDGNSVRLGEIFDDAGLAAKEIVLSAPKPGETKVLSAADLSDLATHYGLTWRPRFSDESVTLHRRAVEVGTAELHSALQRAIAERLPNEDFELELASRDVLLLAPIDAPLGAKVIDLRLDGSQEQFSALVAAADSPEAERTRITGRIYRTEAVPVPARQIAPGATIRADNITFHPMRRDRLAGDIARDLNLVVGKQARRGLKEAAPIRLTDLATPVMIEKGAIVRMIYNGHGINLTALGHALEKGSAGDAIRVLNPQSKAVVQGTVTEINTVTVSLIASLDHTRGDSR
jgi:flagella basal body P-ring formation protein FlgA